MEDRKKIVLVSNTSWSLYNFRLGLIRYLLNEGFGVTVVAPRDSFTSKLIAEGIDYVEVYIKNYSTNPFDDLKIIRQLYRIYGEIKPDLVFHYTIKPNIYGSFAAFFRRIPTILVTTGLGHLFEFRNIILRWTTISLYRIAAWMSKEIWFLNDSDRDVFVYKRIVRARKTMVLKGEGINTDWFSVKKKKNFHGLNRFLFAGRLIWDKGIKEYVEAAKQIKAQYPNTRFEIIGFIDQSNPKAVPYQNIAQWQRQKIIKYLGETSDIRPYLNKATCLVFPSYYREGISRILMEAAAMETPIITTDNVGCKDLVDHGQSGLLVEPRNVDALVMAMEEFIEMEPEDKLVMGKLGRRKMEKNFDEKIILKQYKKAIHRYLDNNALTKQVLKTSNKTNY